MCARVEPQCYGTLYRVWVSPLIFAHSQVSDLRPELGRLLSGSSASGGRSTRSAGTDPAEVATPALSRRDGGFWEPGPAASTEPGAGLPASFGAADAAASPASFGASSLPGRAGSAMAFAAGRQRFSAAPGTCGRAWWQGNSCTPSPAFLGRGL